jgi:rubrerythrin
MDAIMDKEQIDELIRYLVKHELTIASLYENFATILPESKDDWMSLTKEERLHAKWIDTLHTHLKNEKITFEQTQFTIQSVKTAINPK